MIRKITRLLPLVGILIFVYLVTVTGIENIISSFANLNPIYIIGALVLVGVNFTSQTFKWKKIVSEQGIKLGYLYLFRLYLIGAFYGFITPGKIGTFLRIKYIKEKTGKKIGECSVNVVVERFLDLSVLFLLSIFGLIYLLNFTTSYAIFTIPLIFISFICISFIILNENYSRKILKVFWKVIIPKNMKRETRDVFNSFFYHTINWKRMIFPFFIALFSWIVIYSATYMIMLSMGFNIPYFTVIAILPISTIVAMIPITVGGWGTREAMWIFFFSFYGLSSGDIIATSLLSALITYITPAGVGGVFAFLEDRK